MIPLIYSNHFWPLITPPALLLTTQMKRQAQDYERKNYAIEALYKLTKVTKQKAILESKTKKADYTTIAMQKQQIFCS